MPGIGIPELLIVLVVVLLVFGPKRLFNPDTSARYDTRTLAALCDPLDSRVPLYPGQRVTAYLVDPTHKGDTPQGSGQGTTVPGPARTDAMFSMRPAVP